MGSNVGADDRDEQFALQVEQSCVHWDSAIVNQSAPLLIDTFLIIIYQTAGNYKSYFQLARRNLEKSCLRRDFSLFFLCFMAYFGVFGFCWFVSSFDLLLIFAFL